MTSIRTLDLISRLSLFHLPCCGRSILISVLQGILKFNSSIWDRHSLLLNCKCRLSISQDSLRHFWVTWPHRHALWICCLELHQMMFPLIVRIVLSIITRLCSNHFLWIWWLLSTELRWSLGHFFCTFWKSNWVFLPESHWFCLVFSCLFLAKLCVFCFYQLDKCKYETDFSIDSRPWLEEIFDLEGRCIIEDIDEHRKDIFHELIIIFCFQVIPTFSYMLCN